MMKNKGAVPIFIFLAIFSFSLGLWENYKSVWLEINNIKIDYISYIISAGLVLSSFIAILTMVLIKNFNITWLIKISVVLRIFAMVTLCCCFHQEIVWLKVVAFLIESIASNLIVLSIYPLITQNLKTGKIYSKKKLLEYVFTDLGIFVAGIVVAFQLANAFEYNVIAIISAALTCFSLPFALMLTSNNIEKKSSLRNLFKDKICNLYLFYSFVQQTAYYTALGLMTLLLKNLLGLSINFVAVFLIVTALAGDLFGYLALYKLNFKNDYLNYSCKFVLRLIMYLLIACTGNFYVAIIGIAISLLVSRAWENVSDGVYINRVPNENQLLFSTFRYGVNKLGTAFGVFFCGVLFDWGIQAIFGVSAAIMFVSILLAFILIHLRNKEKSKTEIIVTTADTQDSNS